MASFAQKYLLIALIFSISSSNLWARSYKIKLDEKMLNSVNQLLDKTTAFHLALYSQKQDQIKKEIVEMNLNIDSLLKNMGDFQVQNQAMHLKRILKSTKNYLETYQNINGEESRKTSLKKAFSQMVQLIRMYQVDKKYRVFYCKDDNSEWIQEGWKAKNPIHPQKHGACGQRAYR
ncbi:MAG: hypothetical protein VX642_04030 [Bdellovibrionota bacterium]|nr:hypothetical protein [Bdellovibrionota bacterium]